jgi:putative transposase
MKRTNVVKLVVDKEKHEKLKELGIITAKCWNEVNWLRMQQFKKGEKVDFAETEREVYWRYKNLLKVNAQQVARKNAENWRSFFSLIEEKKEGKLPKWFKPRPPGYWRDEGGKYKLIIVIRNDRYEVDEIKRVIHLKNFNLTLRFKGKLKRHGKRGRLEVIYNDARRSWYIHIPVKVENVAEARGSLRAWTWASLT